MTGVKLVMHLDILRAGPADICSWCYLADGSIPVPDNPRVAQTHLMTRDMGPESFLVSELCYRAHACKSNGTCKWLAGNWDSIQNLKIKKKIMKLFFS